MTASFNESVVCPVLIGRTAELAAFYLLIDQAKSGKGQIAMLSGEAGVGKSRLVAEVKTHAEREGFLPLQGNCFQADRAFPYAPFLDLLRSYFSGVSPLTKHHDLTPLAQQLAQVLPDVIPLIPEHPPLLVTSSLDPQQEQRRLFALLLHFLPSWLRTNSCCAFSRISTGAARPRRRRCNAPGYLCHAPGSACRSARQAIASLASTIDDGHLHDQFLQAALATLPREKPVSAKRAAGQAFGSLTERELEVVALIAQGKSNREIAEALVVAKITVETHDNLPKEKF